ncbi:MAG: hypothetical protein RLO52_28050 [Sandaracinaceae bacterium]
MTRALGELEAVDTALSEAGLDPEHRPDVLAMLRTPREQWLPCCGGFCDPCVSTLARVVERARTLSEKPTQR